MTKYFDYNFYISFHKDLKNFNNLDACEHFINNGINERRVFNKKLEYFEYDYYILHNSDLKELNWIDVCNHFINNGVKEERIFNKSLINFDYNFYINYYEEFKELQWIDVCNHFINNGVKEKRIFNKSLINFDYNFYINYYTDLKELNWIDSCNHFIRKGIKEQRIFNKSLISFDYNYYLVNNKNLTDLSWIDICKDFIKNKEKLQYLSIKYIHIPKTAGTSIEEIAYNNNIGWGKYDDDIINNKHLYSGYWHNPEIYNDDNFKDKYKWFCVCRNPYTRVISDINFHLQNKWKDLKDYDEINNYIESLFKYILNTDINNIDYTMFNVFEYHFIPQYYYIENIKDVIILKYENLNEEFNNLMTNYNLHLTLNLHIQKSDKIIELEQLSEVNINLIKEIYKKDFELLNL